jgi:hypothetical protein
MAQALYQALPVTQVRTSQLQCAECVLARMRRLDRNIEKLEAARPAYVAAVNALPRRPETADAQPGRVPAARAPVGRLPENPTRSRCQNVEDGVVMAGGTV